MGALGDELRLTMLVTSHSVTHVMLQDTTHEGPIDLTLLPNTLR